MMTRILLWTIGLYLATAAVAVAGDPVPGAMARMSPYPGLADAVTAVVFNSPQGRIHGHDAERIDVEVNDQEGTAEIRFTMPKDFTLHGDRLVKCGRKDTTWTCADAN
jgi:hypothetical protein